MATEQTLSPNSFGLQEPQTLGVHGVSSLFTAFMLAIVLSILIYKQPSQIITLPLVLLPSLIFFSWHKQQPLIEETDTKTLLRTSLATGTLGMLVLITVQGIVCYAAYVALFGADLKAYTKEVARDESELPVLDPEARAKRAAMANDPRYWTAAWFTCFVIAGFMEETLKYTAVVLARRYGPETVRRPHSYLPLALAATLGFSTVEGLMNVYFDGRKYTKGKLGLNRLVWTVLARTIIGPVGHLLTATLLGINMTVANSGAEETSWLRGLLEVAPGPIFFHGLFDFAVVAICIRNGHVGWVFPRGRSLVLSIVVAVSIQASLALVILARWERLHKLKSV